MPLVDQAAIDVFLLWTVPASAHPGDVFTLRIEATDFAGNTGSAEVPLTVNAATVLTASQTLDSSFDGQSLMLSQGTFTLSGPVHLAALALTRGARVTATAGSGRLDLAVDGRLEVGCDATIDGAKLGFPGGTAQHLAGQAPGGITASQGDAGGSHGGVGDLGDIAGAAGGIFDSVYQPAEGGGGGGFHVNQVYGSSGGAGRRHDRPASRRAGARRAHPVPWRDPAGSGRAGGRRRGRDGRHPGRGAARRRHDRGLGRRFQRLLVRRGRRRTGRAAGRRPHRLRPRRPGSGVGRHPPRLQQPAGEVRGPRHRLCLRRELDLRPVDRRRRPGRFRRSHRSGDRAAGPGQRRGHRLVGGGGGRLGERRDGLPAGVARRLDGPEGRVGHGGGRRLQGGRDRRPGTGAAGRCRRGHRRGGVVRRVPLRRHRPASWRGPERRHADRRPGDRPGGRHGSHRRRDGGERDGEGRRAGPSRHRRHLAFPRQLPDDHRIRCRRGCPQRRLCRRREGPPPGGLRTARGGPFAARDGRLPRWRRRTGNQQHRPRRRCVRQRLPARDPRRRRRHHRPQLLRQQRRRRRRPRRHRRRRAGARRPDPGLRGDPHHHQRGGRWRRRRRGRHPGGDSARGRHYRRLRRRRQRLRRQRRCGRRRPGGAPRPDLRRLRRREPGDGLRGCPQGLRGHAQSGLLLRRGGHDLHFRLHRHLWPPGRGCRPGERGRPGGRGHRAAATRGGGRGEPPDLRLGRLADGGDELPAGVARGLGDAPGRLRCAARHRLPGDGDRLAGPSPVGGRRHGEWRRGLSG